MESLYILIPIAIVFVCIAVGIFLWAVKSDQFEDLERQGYSILFDEDNHIKVDIKPTSASKESDKKQSSTETPSNVEKQNDDA